MQPFFRVFCKELLSELNPIQRGFSKNEFSQSPLKPQGFTKPHVCMCVQNPQGLCDVLLQSPLKLPRPSQCSSNPPVSVGKNGSMFLCICALKVPPLNICRKKNKKIVTLMG